MHHLLHASYRRLYKETGIYPSQWNRYIKHRQSMTERTIRRLADRFGITPAQVLAFVEYRRQLQESKEGYVGNRYYGAH
jgi:plasmid maintenance system antidote protein VapI